MYAMYIWEKIPPHERRDLLVAWLALSAAFTLAMVWGQRLDPFIIGQFFIISLVTAGIAFVVHEMAHKFTAMKYGYWAEFQMNSMMLVVAVAMAALAGIVFAAPGATMIYGTYITREENGKISLAGPVSNLILLIPFAALIFIGQSAGSGLLAIIGLVGVKINAMIAAFNLLPVGPLDGAKILAWNPVIFAGVALIAFGILFGSLSGFF
ncbi:MAG TPA: peptidase M50 [Methanospirillum sp.]|uniref:peptidase M50 n=1 Tax=Methanospirillum sp. TaxID=45200 RepID=UPI002D1C93AE|nr:peptidase M50 [Methanospirillum sp.]HOJ97165.1 peptidase M50 [Methanospirillum sp.]